MANTTFAGTSPSGHPLHERLEEIVGEPHLLWGSDNLASYRRDKSPFRELDVELLVQPGSIAEVQQVLALANAARIPVFARGNGFSLSGFPAPGADHLLVLDTRRLNQVLDVNTVDMTVTAECGVIMADLQQAVSTHGLESPTVAVPQRDTTLGGVLSGVMGGGIPRELATVGGMGQFVLGLTVVLPDGTLLKTNAGGSNVHRRHSIVGSTDGPTLTPLFIGDGGFLGVKVEATLQLLPEAPHLDAGAWEYDTFEDAWQALLDLTSLRELPFSSLNIAEGPPWPLTYGVRASEPNLVHDRMNLIRERLMSHGGRPGSDEHVEYAHAGLRSDQEWAREFLDLDRALVAFVFAKSAFPAALADIRAYVDRRFAEQNLESLGMRHLLHIGPYGRHAVYTSFSLTYDPSRPGGREATRELATETYRLVTQLGGHPEPHQGAVAEVVSEVWSEPFRDLIIGVKGIVDPHATLNRGLWGIAPSPPTE